MIKTIKVGYAPDWTGNSYAKYQIIDETITSKFVCIKAPAVERGYWGEYHLVYSPTAGLCLIDKDEFIKTSTRGGMEFQDKNGQPKIEEETLEYDY